MIQQIWLVTLGKRCAGQQALLNWWLFLTATPWTDHGPEPLRTQHRRSILFNEKNLWLTLGA